MGEEEEFDDLVFMPVQSKSKAAQLRFVLSFLRDFQFRWLFVVQQDSFVHIEQVFNSINGVDPPYRTIVGGWHKNEASGHAGRLQPEFFGMTRDVHALISSHRVAPWLRIDFNDESTAMSDAVNAWLSVLTVRKITLPGVYTEGRGSHCP